MAPNDHLKNAELNIQVLQNELLNAGLKDDACRLNGLELSTPASAQAAIEVVRGLRLANGHTPKKVMEHRDWTIVRLEDAVKQSALPA